MRKLLLQFFAGLFIATTVSAISFKDSGWVDYGKTTRTRQFTKRRIDISSPLLGSTGLIYIHKKGQATRGEKYPYLPFGLTTFQRNWRMSGLFDLKLNGEDKYLYKHLSGVPKFEYLLKTFEAIILKVTLPCGRDGNVVMLVHVAKDKNYFDFTFDLSEFKPVIKDLSIIFYCLPGHSGKLKKAGKRVAIPLNRIFRTAERTINHKANKTQKLNKSENWLLLYDKESGYGSCAIMFDANSVSSCSLTGNRVIRLAAKVKKGVKKIRFLLWEFPAKKYSRDDAYTFLETNAQKLLEVLRQSSIKTAKHNGRPYYKAIQTKMPLSIDGKGNDAAWQIAPWSTPFYDLKSAKTAKEKTRFKIVYDAKNLYILVKCATKYPAEIVANERNHDGNRIFLDDSVEIFLSPQNSSENYLQMVFNSLSTKWDAIIFHNTNKKNKNWNPKWTVATYCDETGWTAEVKIPFMSMLLTAEVNNRWMLNIARNNQTGKSKPGYQPYSTWSKLNGKFHDPEHFNELTGINEDLHYAKQEKKFRAYGMKATKRTHGVSSGIEVVAKGCEDAYLYYPTKEIYLPANGRVLRSIFDFKESRSENRDLWRLRKGKVALKEYLKNISFHFLLPEGVTIATDKTSLRLSLFTVEKISERHIALHPLLPSEYGELWNGVNLELIPIFLKHNLKPGTRVPIDSWMEFRSPAEKSSVIRSYINIIKFPWVEKMPKQISINRLWSFYSDIKNYPDFARTSKASGFTGVPIFAGDLLYDGGQNNRKYSKEIVNKKRRFLINLAKKARNIGLKVYLTDTTYNKVGFNKNTQWGGMITGFPLGNPGYRGPLYQSDIDDVVTAYKLLSGADRISMDIECFKRVTERRFGYFGKGGEDTARIQALAKQRNTTVENIFIDYGTEMIRDIYNAIMKANQELKIETMPELLVWNVSADETNPMEGLFDYKKLYPKYLPLLNPHVYFEDDSRKIGNRIKRNRRILGKSNIIACMTMRHKRVDLDYTELRDQILECFYNGAIGINYFPMAFDQNDTYGQLLALQEVLPFEEILVNGKFITLTKDDSPTQVVGFSYKNAAVLLVSNYQTGVVNINVVNPLKQASEVYSVSAKKILGRIAADGTITITLDKRRTAVIYFGDREITR
jgi:hypothetical protein